MYIRHGYLKVLSCHKYLFRNLDVGNERYIVLCTFHVCLFWVIYEEFGLSWCISVFSATCFLMFLRLSMLINFCLYDEINSFLCNLIHVLNFLFHMKFTQTWKKILMSQTHMNQKAQVCLNYINLCIPNLHFRLHIFLCFNKLSL